MISSPKMLRPRKFQSLKVELEWLIFHLKIYNFSYFISGDINLLRFILIQNLKTWVIFIWAIIYYQFFKNAQTQRIIVFEIWIIIVNNKVLRKKIPLRLLLVKIFLCEVFFPKPQNMGKMHISNYLWSVLQNCFNTANYVIY